MKCTALNHLSIIFRSTDGSKASLFSHIRVIMIPPPLQKIDVKEINIHCLCGSNGYMVVIPLETKFNWRHVSEARKTYISNGINTIYPSEPHKQ